VNVDGWVYRDDEPPEHLIVTVRLGGVTIGSATANRFRQDLKSENIGAGDHAYLIHLDQTLDKNQLSEVSVVASSSDGQSKSLPLPISSTPKDESPKSQTVASHVFTRLHMERALKYGVTYAEGSELLPPVGLPIDFIDDKVLEESSSWVQASPCEMRDRIQRDVVPIPHSHNREGYAEGNDLIYWLSGFDDYRMIEGLAAEYGINGGRYFDFGGSTGRVFRNFAFQTNAWEVWSCDFKISSVEFNLKYFPTRMRLFLNTSFPTLPIPDSSFDLISACSVFTHIDESETSWLLELRRTLKIGGLACISIHSKETWEQMHGELRDNVIEFRPDIAGESALPEGKTVVTFRNDDPYRCHTFHSDDYIHRNWGRFFEICEIRPLVLGIQAMVICRRVD
jgi:ubiquinone/menaquinone biosynthesis C-methylase UbiE